MHCSDEELLISNIEAQLHIETCKDCQQRLLQLQMLKEDAKSLTEYQPSDFAWIKVKASIPKKKKRHTFMFPFSIAASVIVSVTLTLLINSKWQDHNIDALVATSNAYEQQLVSMQLPNALVGNKLWEISQIDIQLNLNQSKSSQKKLWQKRNETLKKVLATTSKTELI
jgi:hypothetical protein